METNNNVKKGPYTAVMSELNIHPTHFVLHNERQFNRNIKLLRYLIIFCILECKFHGIYVRFKKQVGAC